MSLVNLPATLVLVALCAAQDPKPSVGDLVRQLDDDSFELRNRASAQLAELGPEVLPRLQEELPKASLEAKGRLLLAIRNIQDRALLQTKLRPATLVELENRRLPLRSAVESLARQVRSTCDVKEIPDSAQVSIVIAKVPFWEALDRLCRPAELSVTEGNGETIRIIRGRPPASVTSGAFHVALTEVSLDVDPVEAPRGYSLEFLTLWENGIRPDAVRVKFDQIKDDKGTDLLGEDGDPWSGTSGSIFPEGRRLSYRTRRNPAPNAKRIARLAGQIQIGFALQSTTLTLKDPAQKAGQEVSADGFTLRLREFADGEQARGAFTLEGPKNLTIFADLIKPAVIDSNGKSTTMAVGDFKDGHLNVGFILGESKFGRVATLQVTLPRRVHIETVDFDFRDVPFH